MAGFRAASIGIISAVIASASLAYAVVGDPQIKTDHAYYQGELAYSTTSRIVQSAFATPGRVTTGNATKDQILQLYYWRIEHYFHLMSPETWSIPGETPDPSANNPLRIEYDCLTSQFSYGWGLCGTNHATIRPILEAAGFGSRRRGIVGDTAHEVFYNGRWALLNADSASVISLVNSTSADFAGVDDIINNVGLLLNNPLNIPQYSFGSTVTGAQGTHSQDWYYYYDSGFSLPIANSWIMYGEGFQARPIVYSLKVGEKFTRFGDRDGLPSYLSDPGGYRFWGYVGAGGAYRDWSYVGLAPAQPTPPSSNARGDSRFGNGIFEWSPNVGAGEHQEGIYAADSNVTFDTTSPKLRTSGGSGQVTFHFFSPYVIVAKPAGGADPGPAGATGGAWIDATAVGSVAVEVSSNNGATWQSAGNLTGSAALDFTDLAKGRHQYLLRLTLSSSTGLDSFKLNTAVQVSEGVWPWLSDNNTTVTYNAGGTNGLEVIPDYTNQTAADTFKVDDSGNVTFSAQNSGNSWAYTSTNNQPCYLTYRVAAPNGAILQRIHGGADANVRVPPAGNPHMRLHVSTNGGASFTQFGEYLAPSNNELSHGWVYGTADVSSANVNEALVRVEFYNGGYTAKLRFVRLYGEYATASPAGLTITHTWDDDGGSGKSFNTFIPAGTTSTSYIVPTSTNPVHRSVTFEVVTDPTLPVASFTAAPNPATEGDTVNFDGSASTDDVGIVTYTWDFDDGGAPVNTTGPTTSHPYNTAGTYNVTLTVTDGDSNTHMAAVTLAVNPPGGTPVTETFQEGVSAYAGTEDTYIDQFAPASNFGDTDRLEVRWYDDGTGLSEHNHTLIQFDLSTIPTNATVNAAKLTLYQTRGAAISNGDIIQMGQVTSSWNEAHTWNAGVPGSTPGGVTLPPVDTYANGDPVSPPAPFVINGMDSLVQDWITNPSTNYGVIFTASNNLNFRFASSEHAQAQYRPELELTYTTPGGGDTSPPQIAATALRIAGALDDPTIRSVDVAGTPTPVVGGSFQSGDIALASGATPIAVSATDPGATVTRSLLATAP